ncbi:MAG: hypothetical protein PHV55_02185 [Candidatus Omnitrophica bacterium]|nr:hypothetical protein [Candidatus Omnitrophota bacterium]
MKKISIKNLDLRTRIYAVIFIFFVLSVFIRITLVWIDRNRAIVSFTSQWSKYGKPVIVEEIKEKDIPVYTKFTIRIISDTLATGFVTADIKDKLKEGQEVYSADRGITLGTISYMGQELDMDTGMFPLKITFNAPVAALGSTSVVFARTQTLQKVLVVSNNLLDISGDEYYLWKIDKGRAKRTRVRVGLSNGYGAVISEGINSGDLIVSSGRSMLSENDNVHIISDPAVKRIDIKGRRL